MNLFELAVVVVASYLVGAIPIGYLMVTAAQADDDIRDHGSGNDRRDERPARAGHQLRSSPA